jgi:hypothetical protein
MFHGVTAIANCIWAKRRFSKGVAQSGSFVACSRVCTRPLPRAFRARPCRDESQDPVHWAPRSAALCCAIMKRDRCGNEGRARCSWNTAKRRSFAISSVPKARRPIARGSLPLEGSRAERARLSPTYNIRCFSKNGRPHPVRSLQNCALKSLAHLRLKHLLILLLTGASFRFIRLDPRVARPRACTGRHGLRDHGREVRCSDGTKLPASVTTETAMARDHGREVRGSDGTKVHQPRA